jgi:hypothetical protein
MFLPARGPPPNQTNTTNKTNNMLRPRSVHAADDDADSAKINQDQPVHFWRNKLA